MRIAINLQRELYCATVCRVHDHRNGRSRIRSSRTDLFLGVVPKNISVDAKLCLLLDDRRAWMEPSVAPALDAMARVVAFSSRHPLNATDRRNDFDLFIVTR
jgi:hypothetical protein